MSAQAETLAETFKNEIIGQPRAVEAFTRVLDKIQSGFYDKTKPIASLLFLGPTGTGKTASVEAFTKGMLGGYDKLIRIDCAEFQHSHEIAKLKGSPPGYLGHRETHPLLTQEALDQYHTDSMKLTVLLFDEIEKASDSLWTLLLGILDKASLTLGDNRKVDFSHCVIVMTSNVGSAQLAAKVGDNDSIGYNTPSKPDVPYDAMAKTALDAARRKFMPEFINRLDDTVVFNTLTPDNIKEIFKLEFFKLRVRMVLNSPVIFDLVVSPAAEAAILVEGYDKRYNARELKRTIEMRISTPVSRLVATNQILTFDTVVIDYDKDWTYFAKSPTDTRVEDETVSAGRLEV